MADSTTELPFTVTPVRGLVNLVFPDMMMRRVPFQGGTIPVGAILETVESESSAVLQFIDGTTVTLTSESSLRVLDAGWRLVLRRGNATADTRRGAESARLVFDTSVTRLSRLSGSLCYIGHADASTEVGVESGVVTVSDFSGKPLDVVRTGELLTVDVAGQRCKHRIPAMLDEFAWAAPARFPAGLHVGRQQDVPGEAVEPVLWYDPYHSERMYQIRSHGRWARGFFRLFPESVIRIRYRTERSGPGQFVICVREATLPNAATGNLEYDGVFEQTPPGEWRWIEVRAADILNTRHSPAFGPPWVAHQLIFNTYTADLGLSVAELRVTRPGGPASS